MLHILRFCLEIFKLKLTISYSLQVRDCEADWQSNIPCKNFLQSFHSNSRQLSDKDCRAQKIKYGWLS